MGGMVLETNMNEILTRIEEQNKIEKEEVRLTLELPLGRFKSVGVATCPNQRYSIWTFKKYSSVTYFEDSYAREMTELVKAGR